MIKTRAAGACAIAALVALCTAAFVLDALLLRKMMELHMNDFGKFYYSARAFLDGADMYAPSPATNLRFENAPDIQYLNLNPPHFHLLVLPFARLPPDAAGTLWIAVSIFALLISLMLIRREIGGTWTPVGALVAIFVILAFA